MRLAKWFTTLNPKTKAKIVKDVTQLVLARRTRMCNFLEYKDSKVVYRRYASLFFVTGIAQDDNELVTLEIIHRYVEILDRYFGNVSGKAREEKAHTYEYGGSLTKAPYAVLLTPLPTGLRARPHLQLSKSLRRECSPLFLPNPSSV